MANRESQPEKSQQSFWKTLNLIPRDYQTRLSDKATDRIEKQKGGIIIAPTGAGKSFVIADISYKSIQKNTPIIIVQPTREILEQNIETLLEYGIINDENKKDVSVLINKNEPIFWQNDEINKTEQKIPHGLEGKIVFATCGSLIRIHEEIENYLSQKPLMIFDEFHRAGALETKKIVELFKDNLIGLTATPFRTDYLDLGSLFDDTLQNVIIDIVSYQEAIDAGAVVPGKVSLGARQRFQNLVGEQEIWALSDAFDDAKRFKDSNLDQLSQQIFGKLFSEAATETEKKLAQKMTAATIKIWEERAENRNTITHAENIAHARHLFEGFKSLNTENRIYTVAYIDADEAMYYDGQTLHQAKGAAAKKLRKKIIMDARANKIKNIINCNTLREGVDIPSASCTLFACHRRTLGPAMQIIGRTSRSYTDAQNNQSKIDNLIIDTGTTLSSIAKFDKRFNAGEFDFDKIDSQNQANYEFVNKMGFFGISKEEMQTIYLDQQKDDQKRIKSHKIKEDQKIKIQTAVQQVLEFETPQAEVKTVSLKDYTERLDQLKSKRQPSLLYIADGAWAAVHSKMQNQNGLQKYTDTSIFILRKDAVSKLFPYLVRDKNDRYFPEFISISFNSDEKNINISAINNPHEIQEILNKPEFDYSENEKAREDNRLKQQASDKQNQTLKYRFEPLRKNHLARLVSPLFARESSLHASIAITLSSRWEDIAKTLPAWAREHKINTPAQQRSNTRRDIEEETITICAIPGYYSNNDMKDYLLKAKELSYSFKNAIIIGNEKNSFIKEIIDHYKQNNIKTIIINPAKAADKAALAKYPKILQSWNKNKLRLFGTNESLSQARQYLKSASSLQKEASQKIVA